MSHLASALHPTNSPALPGELSHSEACATLQVRPDVKDADWQFNQAASHPP